MKRHCAFRTAWVLTVFIIMLCSRAGWAAPNCTITREDPGPPLTIEFTIIDTSIGLRSIEITQSINANVDIPIFPAGIVNPVLVTATKMDQSGDFTVALLAKDMLGNQSTCSYTEDVTDKQPPSCTVTAEDPGPPGSVEITIQDTGSGLKSITTTESINASVDIPAFTPGILSPVAVTATQVDQSMDFTVTFETEDMSGNQDSCSYTFEVADSDPPVCEITANQPGPPARIEMTVRDEGSGLMAINLLEAINTTVSIPTFTPGTSDSIVVSATQILSNLEFSFQVEALDRKNNSSICQYPEVILTDMRPEFDGVGDDSNNFFNGYSENLIIANSRDAAGNQINEFSEFASEYFHNTTGNLTPDSCFSTSTINYPSVLTPSWTEATYEWQITLQMKPAADIYLRITNCILKSGADNIWKDSRQTGHYRVPWAQDVFVFIPDINPTITVAAIPGPLAVQGFPADGFYLDFRKLPGLETATLVDSLFTMETLSEENIVLVLPQSGANNAIGQTLFDLNQGDQIRITIKIHNRNSADVRFGSDNVELKYLGFAGTEYSTLDEAAAAPSRDLH